jgi:rRNA processing protein Krr1/Pno1
MVRFPPQGSEDSAIRVEGNQAVVDKIVAAIESFVNSKDSQVTETIDVAPSKHRLLIGHNGEKRRNLESQFSVTLDIPRQNTPGAAGSQVKISGQPGDVEKAKERILDLVKDQSGETVHVPVHLHHVIADNGSFFRALRNEHKVKVDHGRQQPPPRPAAAAPRSKTSGGNLPLITDDPSSSDLNYSWDIVEPARLPETSETIPWILQGSPAAVAKAKELIEAKMQNSGEGSYTGYLVLPDPRSYGLIVGPGGSKINQLRKQSGAQINVPKPGAKDEAVEISGPKEGCEKAKDLILELIKSQGQGGRRSS